MGNISQVKINSGSILGRNSHFNFPQLFLACQFLDPLDRQHTNEITGGGDAHFCQRRNAVNVSQNNDIGIKTIGQRIDASGNPFIAFNSQNGFDGGQHHIYSGADNE